MTRSFVALPLPGAVTEALEQVQQGLGTGRMVPGENMHVTLAFLDDQPPPVLAALHEGLSEIVMPALNLTVQGIEVAGGRQPRLVWAGVARTPELVALRKAVLGAARAAGIELPRARFRPHVTLARFPRHLPVEAAQRLGWFLEAQGALRLNPVRVEEFGLYASTLHEAGPVYEELVAYPLE